MSEGLRVVPLPVPNLNDIPLMLRRLADEIEAGQHGAVRCALAIVLEHGCISPGVIRQWGDVNLLEVVGLLEMSKQHVFDPDKALIVGGGMP